MSSLVRLESSAHLLSLIRRCKNSKNLKFGGCIHSFLVEIGLDSDGCWAAQLIHFYASCGCLLDARKTFHNVFRQNIYTWNAIISAYITHDEYDVALNAYTCMRHAAILPDRVTYLLVLRIASCKPSSHNLWFSHAEAVKIGLVSDIVISNALINAYTKYYRIHDARELFDSLPVRDVVSWTTMIAGYVQLGNESLALQMYEDMKREGIQPGRATLLSVLKACRNLEDAEWGKLMHHDIVYYGLDTDTAIGNTLLDMLAKCGSLEDAQKLFDQLDDQKAVSWGIMISGYALNGRGFSALEIFERMQDVETSPSKNTMSCILKACLRACGSESAITQGRWIHDLIIKNGLNPDAAIESSLVDMYGKCGRLYEAYGIFLDTQSRDVVLWGALIAAYAQHGHADIVLELYETMHDEDLNPNEMIFSSVLKACANSAMLLHGRDIHGEIVRRILEINVVLGNALIDMYIKCGSIDEAKNVFDDMPNKDEVSWGTMILGCAQHDSALTLELLGEMKEKIIKFGSITAVCILKGCACVESVKHGMWVHDLIIMNHIEVDPLVGNNLLGMYVKCESMEEANKVFESLPCRDLTSWGIMIAGYSVCGNSYLARKYFEDMKRQGLTPDDIIFISILTTCSHAGLLEEGRTYFRSMKEEYGIMPSAEHYSCIISLLGRAGWLTEAETYLRTTPLEPKSEAMLWRSLLTCCRAYCNTSIAKRCLKAVTSLDPTDASAYLLMSDIYCDSHLWSEVCKIEELRQSVGAKKVPGRASIQMENSVHEFRVGDCTHSEANGKMARLMKVMMLDGRCVPNLDLMMETDYLN